MITKSLRGYISVAALLFMSAVPSMSQIFKSPPTLYPSGGSFAQSVAVADVNKDGKPDVIVANASGGSNGTVGVFLGNGDGTFQPAAVYHAPLGADSVAAADLNGDGWPDLVVAGSKGNGGSQNLAVLLNNGDGTFRAPVYYSSGGYNISSVAVADVDGDGIPDLVLTNVCGNNACTYSSVGVILGKGDATFGPVVDYRLSGLGALSVTAGDLRQTGKPDLLVASTYPGSANGSVSVLLNKGNGDFEPEVKYPSGGLCASSIVVGDVNGDGKLDAVVGNNGCSSEVGPVGVLLGHGDGTFGSVLKYSPGGTASNSVALGDFNGDGKPDIVVALVVAPGNPSGAVGVLLNNGHGAFNTPAVTYSTGGRNSNSVAVADLNQDGKPDLVVADRCDGYGSTCPLGGGLAVLIGVPARTTTTVTTSGSPSLVGRPVTFKATITAAYGPIPNGVLVTFYDGYGSTAIGTGTTKNGVATFTTSALTANTHTIRAVYPSSAFFKSSSGAVKQVVN
jgi:hypothetical protein